MGIVLMLGCARMGPGLLQWRPGLAFQPSVVLLLVVVVLLACVWVPGVGVESHGKHRWVAFGAVRFQPSEVAKIALVVFLAALLCRRNTASQHRIPDLTIPMLAIAVVCAMVGREDFGTAVLLAVVGGLMLMVRGCPLSTTAAWTIPAVGAFIYMIVSQPYRIERLLGFLRIWEDPHGVGYHPMQSLAAIASGGWAGRGLGAGLAKYGYLPESGSDFVFSIICEEIGFFGGVVVILFFVVLVVLGMRTMMLAPSEDGGFAKLFAFGVTVTIALQGLMNIAVVTAVAPTKGIALPLVSAGGSGLLCFSVAIGLLAGVPRRPVVAPVPPREAMPEKTVLTQALRK